MTKFEEELNKIVVEVQTPLDKYIVEKATSDESLYAQHYEAVLEKFKDWHSDEDYQKAKRMVEHVKFENELLKAKLKQQALPVVPECVGEYIEECKGNLSLYGALFHIFDNTNKELNNWVFREANQDLFARAWLEGYTVEKPQLFYLKNKLTTSYLILDTSTGYFEHWGSTEATGRYKSSFTQQEIGSMETGSYELVPVEDGE